MEREPSKHNLRLTVPEGKVRDETVKGETEENKVQAARQETGKNSPEKECSSAKGLPLES